MTERWQRRRLSVQSPWVVGVLGISVACGDPRQPASVEPAAPGSSAGGSASGAGGEAAAAGSGPRGASGAAGGGLAPLDCSEQACLSRELANWPMPNSAQLPLPNPPRLVRGEDGVLDAITGLIWADSHSALSDFSGAQAHCRRLAEQTDERWRLPTRIELVSLVEPARVPSIDEVMFPETPADYFWSQSSVVGREAARYSVYFGLGETAVGLEPQVGAYARCVRAGNRVAPPEFEVFEQIVRDRATGLVWQRRPLETALSLDAARWYCQQLMLDSGSGSFRLPSAKELQTLVDPGLGLEGSLIDPDAFPDTPAGAFWAEDLPSRPRLVDFALGTSTVTDIGDSNHVRCVR